MNPTDATSAVISTGRNRTDAPSRTASSSECPDARSWLMYDTITSALSTATPATAMNPTDALRLRWMLRSQSDAIPPTSANGTAVITISV